MSMKDCPCGDGLFYVPPTKVARSGYYQHGFPHDSPLVCTACGWAWGKP